MVFFGVNRASGAEKSRLVRAHVRASPHVSRNAREIELMVPGDSFHFCDDAVFLCFACVETLSALALPR